MCVFLFLAGWVGILWHYAQKMKVLLPPEETASVSVSAPLPVFTTGGRVFTIHDWALTSPDWETVRKVRPRTSPAAKKSSVALKGAKKP